MATEYTTHLTIPKIDPSVDPRIDIDVNKAIDRIDQIAALDITVSTLASRPSPGVPGRFVTVNSEGVTYRDNGTQWIPITNNAPGSIKPRHIQDGAITMEKMTPKTFSLSWHTLPSANILPPVHSMSPPIQYSVDPYNIVRFRFSGAPPGLYVFTGVKLFHLNGLPTPSSPYNANTDFEISFNDDLYRWEVKSLVSRPNMFLLRYRAV